MHDTLRQCEREVEQARSKLSHDLATLRAPETISAFTDDLKRDAIETKDVLLDQVTQTAQSKLSDFVEELKARAAANPVATLAIGAGIAWRLLRHPPIATALIGAGVYGLWRTNGFHPHDGSRPDYLQHGKQRLKEQASDFASDVASSAKEIAADVGDTVSAKTAEMVDAAKTKAQEWSGSAQAKAQEWSETAQAKAQEWSGTAQTKAQQLTDDVGRGAAAVRSALIAETDSLNARAQDAVQSVSDRAKSVSDRAKSVSDRARSATMDASSRTSQFMRETIHDTRDALADSQSRDKLLLGVAGVAVAAALGMACQKRIAEEVE
jgi:hypothetical protein